MANKSKEIVERINSRCNEIMRSEDTYKLYRIQDKYSPNYHIGLLFNHNELDIFLSCVQNVKGDKGLRAFLENFDSDECVIFEICGNIKGIGPAITLLKEHINDLEYIDLAYCWNVEVLDRRAEIEARRNKIEEDSIKSGDLRELALIGHVLTVLNERFN